MLRRALTLTLVTSLALAAVPSAQAWVGDDSQPHHADLAVEAAKLLPPEEADVLLAHEDALRAGANDPDARIDAYFHREDARDPDWGGAIERTQEHHERAVEALEDGRHHDAAYELGLVSHFVLDLAQPMHSAGADAIAHEAHAAYEAAAYDHRAGLAIDAENRGALPLVAREPQAAAAEAAAFARDLWPELARALDAAPEEGAWSSDVEEVTDRALAHGLLVTASLYHGAFAEVGLDARSDAAAPEPEESGEERDARLVTTWATGGVVLTLALLAVGWRRAPKPERRRAGERRP